jgi:chemotaxis protein CheD
LSAQGQSATDADNDIFLLPGELWFGKGKRQIRTILGSCVAFTVWHPGHGVGGMCHYMLPSRPSMSGGSTSVRDGRYGDEALEILVSKIRSVGTQPGEYVTKIFGGGSMFQSSDRLPVPDRNINAARELASRHGFLVAAEHLGGQGHRHVTLDVRTGSTWLKHNRPVSTEPATLAIPLAFPSLQAVNC